MSGHYAEYGNTKIQRDRCPSCRRYSFVINNHFQCCDREISFEGQEIKKMSIAYPYRKYPLKKEQKEILECQQNRCLYCEAEFGSIVFKNGKSLILRLEWDHQVPFSYSQNNGGSNFCASCHICNRIKSSKMFQTVDEAIIYIQHVRNKKGYSS